MKTIGSEWSKGTIVAENEAHSFVCDKRGRASRRIICAPFEVDLTLPKNPPPPNAISVTISGLVNNVGWQGDFLPQYDFYYPNGKRCDRTGCARTALEIPLGALEKVDDAGDASRKLASAANVRAKKMASKWLDGTVRSRSIYARLHFFRMTNKCSVFSRAQLIQRVCPSLE